MSYSLTSPLVELDGDETARLVWQLVKQRLILKYVDVPIEYFDLNVQARDSSNDRVTYDAGVAIKQFGVGVKCPTMTLTREKAKELGLKEAWRCPNATIRNMLSGTMFYEPIICDNIPRCIPNWKAPIIVARHAFADQYRATDFVVDRPGRFSIAFIPDDGSDETILQIYQYRSGGVGMAMYNTDESIKSFAHSCFNFALERKIPLILSTRASLLRDYDMQFYDIFEEMFAKFYHAKFQENSLFFQHQSVETMTSFAMKSNGGFLWACKNYDGEIASQMVSQGFGSASMVCSMLISSDGKAVLSEASVTTNSEKSWKDHLTGRELNVNPIPSIFAWTRALAHKAKKENNRDVAKFALLLEAGCVRTVEEGKMTKDLALAVRTDEPGAIRREHFVNTEEFVELVAEYVDAKLEMQGTGDD